MATFEVAGDTLAVEIIADREPTPTFVLQIRYKTADLIRFDTVILDAESRFDLTVDRIKDLLQSWAADHDPEYITAFSIVEQVPARYGTRIGGADTADETAPHAQGGREYFFQERAQSDETDSGKPGDQKAPLPDGTRALTSSTDEKPIDRADEYEPGDHIAYYVQGPDHPVYGHTTDGIIEAVPPYTPGAEAAPGRDHVVVNIGTQRPQEIPIDWIAGHVNDDDVTVDNPHDLSGDAE